MIKNILTILLSFLFLILDTPAYSFDSSPKAVEKYTLKISRKFSNTFCNSTKFGISKEKIGDIKGACDDWIKASSLGNERTAEWVRDQC